jgi:hypothetical protein
VTAYAVYNSAGEIISTGSCPEHDLHLKTGEGEFLYIGQADAHRQKIVEGVLVDKPVDNSVSPEELLKQIRQERNMLISKTDWTQMPDSPLSDIEKGWWASYRQQLRDLPQNVSDITSLDDVVWPIPPN